MLDFGLARISPAMELSRSRSVARQALVSSPGEVKRNAGARIEVRGTPGYMSPEQIRGEALDQRTDVFSSGVVFYEMLTGNLPFGSQTPSHFTHAVLNEEPFSLSVYRSDVPLELESIIRKALAKDRDGRFATSQELGGAIRAVIAELEYDGPGSLPAVTPAPQAWLSRLHLHRIANSLLGFVRARGATKELYCSQAWYRR